MPAFRNDSFPMVINLHWHIIHLSINQKEQTMTIHGHLYMVGTAGGEGSG